MNELIIFLDCTYVNVFVEGQKFRLKRESYRENLWISISEHGGTVFCLHEGGNFDFSLLSAS